MKFELAREILYHRNCMRLLFIFFLLMTATAFGQTCPNPPSANSAAGSFTVDAGSRICVGQTVQITDNSGGTNMQYWYQHTGTTVPTTGGTTARSFTYNTAGKYVIIQQGSLNGTGSYFCRTIEVLARPVPSFTVKNCTVGQVTLTIPQATTNVYDEYSINWGDGSTATIVTSSQLGTAIFHQYPPIFNNRTVAIQVRGLYLPSRCGNTGTVNQPLNAAATPLPIVLNRLELNSGTSANLQFVGQRGIEMEIFQKPEGGTYVSTNLKNTSTSLITQAISGLDNTKQYCFQVRADDGCGKSVSSEELCSIPLSVAAENQQNRITWKAYPTPSAAAPFRSLTLTKNSTTFPPAITSINTTERLDNQVVCGTQYCYQATALIGSMISVSERKCVTAISSLQPPALTNLYATVVPGDKITLGWDPPRGTALSFGILRADNGTDFAPVATTPRPPYTDTANPNTRSYCYQVNYTDLCNNVSANSVSFCTVFLKQNGDQIEWTGASPTANPVAQYLVEQVDANGNIIGAQIRVGTARSFTPDPNSLGGQTARFRIRTIASTGFQSVSNTIEYALSMKILVPDIFTPNGDGVNDAFIAKTLFVNEYTLTVYDRWGNPVFHTEDLTESWDGLLSGQPAPTGTYSYILVATDSKGQKFEKRGGLQLVR